MSTSRDQSRARAFETIPLFKPISRSEIANHPGLSSASITYIIDELKQFGTATDLGRHQTTRGPPSVEPGLCASSAYTIGLHISHEHISNAVADLRNADDIEISDALSQHCSTLPQQEVSPTDRSVVSFLRTKS